MILPRILSQSLFLNCKMLRESAEKVLWQTLHQNRATTSENFKGVFSLSVDSFSSELLVEKEGKGCFPSESEADLTRVFNLLLYQKKKIKIKTLPKIDQNVVVHKICNAYVYPLSHHPLFLLYHIISTSSSTYMTRSANSCWSNKTYEHSEI